MSRSTRCSGRGGFSLLEVMIGLAILSVGLVAVLGLNAGAMAMHSYSTRVTVATLLARGKMLDIEAQLKKEGVGDFDKELDGDFADEGWPEYKWRAEIKKPDIQLDADTLVNALLGKADEEGVGGGGALEMLANMAEAFGGAGSQAGSTFLPMVQQFLPRFLEEIKKSVREVTLTVSWPAGKSTEKMDVSTLMVILSEEPGVTTPQIQIQ